MYGGDTDEKGGGSRSEMNKMICKICELAHGVYELSEDTGL